MSYSEAICLEMKILEGKAVTIQTPRYEGREYKDPIMMGMTKRNMPMVVCI